MNRICTVNLLEIILIFVSEIFNVITLTPVDSVLDIVVPDHNGEQNNLLKIIKL